MKDDYYGVRAKKAQEHMARLREVFDEDWNTAEMQVVAARIKALIAYLDDNRKYFPNYKEHVEQWLQLKEVAECRACSDKNPCKHDRCPNK